MPPCYSHLELPKHVMRNVSSFRLRAHHVHKRMTLSRGNPPSAFPAGHCDKCFCAAVQNELHVLFYCQDCMCALSERSIRSFFPFLPIFFCGGPLCCACLASSDCLWFPFSMSQQTLPFHLGHNGLFLAGKDQQQTNQPNGQAGS